MSRLPRGAARADSRARSRRPRRLLARSRTLPVGPHERPGISDPASQACRAWLERDAKQQALISRWQSLEARLISEGHWGDGSEAQLTERPDELELQSVERELLALDHAKQGLLEALPDIEAASAEGVLMKLRVLSSAIRPEDNPCAYRLLVSIQRELQATVLET